jgi:hypothetical protein
LGRGIITISQEVFLKGWAERRVLFDKSFVLRRRKEKKKGFPKIGSA